MTDGYELYNGIACDHRLAHLGCWAHVRRGFIKAEGDRAESSAHAGPAGYTVRRVDWKAVRCRGARREWTAQRRQRLRTRYNSRVLAIVEHMMIMQLPTIVPSSLLGKALQYMSGHWYRQAVGRLPETSCLASRAGHYSSVRASFVASPTFSEAEMQKRRIAITECAQFSARWSDLETRSYRSSGNSQ